MTREKIPLKQYPERFSRPFAFIFNFRNYSLEKIVLTKRLKSFPPRFEISFARASCTPCTATTVLLDERQTVKRVMTNDPTARKRTISFGRHFFCFEKRFSSKFFFVFKQLIR